MTPLVKAGVVGGTLTSLAGAGYASTYLFPSPTKKVSDLITKQDLYILLKTGNDQDTTHWTKAWNAYKKDNNGKTNDIFGLKGWKSDGTFDATAELKKKCEGLKDSLVYDTDDDQYKNITKYCSRAITVEDQARRKGLVILDTVGDTSSDVWSQRNTGKAGLQTHIEKLGMTYSTVDANGIKAGCGTAKTKDKVATNDYYLVYAAYEAVCTKPK